jgi:hypothetical protein
MDYQPVPQMKRFLLLLFAVCRLWASPARAEDYHTVYQ